MLYFASTSDLNTWRGSDRSFTIEYTGSGSEPSWDYAMFDLDSSTEDTVNTTSNYIIYMWSDLDLTDTQSDDLAQQIVSAGNGNSIVDIVDLG